MAVWVGTRVRVRAVALGVVTVVCAVPASAQSPGSFDIGAGAGAFIDYPTQFSGSSCTGRGVGISGTGAWRALSFLAIEGSAIATTGTQSCQVTEALSIPVDTPYTNLTYADGVEGSGFIATHLSVIVEPFGASPISPRARLGVGRLWDRGLNNWLWGVGIRYRFGRHSLVMDVDGWNMEFESQLETLIYRSSTGMTELLNTEAVSETVRPYQVRVGWEMVIG